MLANHETIVTGFSQPPTIPRTDSHESERDALAYQFPNSSEFSEPIFYHNGIAFLLIHRPYFGENGRNFEVVMNRQTFFRAKRVEEREGEREK